MDGPVATSLRLVVARFTARLFAESGATVLPTSVDGDRGRLFQMAGHLPYTLRMALLVNEFKALVGAPMLVVIGRHFDPASIAAPRGR
jgi:hypothetical protein